MFLFNFPVRFFSSIKCLFFVFFIVLSGCATVSDNKVGSSERFTFKDTPEGARLSIPDRVLFAKGEYTLQDESIKLIDSIKPILDNAEGDIIVEGHTDKTGSKAGNDVLSKRRAEEVKKIIIKRYEIAPSRVKAKGYGSSRPDITNAETAAELAKNRRAVLLFPGETVDDLEYEGFFASLAKSFSQAGDWMSNLI